MKQITVLMFLALALMRFGAFSFASVHPVHVLADSDGDEGNGSDDGGDSGGGGGDSGT